MFSHNVSYETKQIIWLIQNLLLLFSCFQAVVWFLVWLCELLSIIIIFEVKDNPVDTDEKKTPVVLTMAVSDLPDSKSSVVPSRSTVHL